MTLFRADSGQTSVLATLTGPLVSAALAKWGEVPRYGFRNNWGSGPVPSLRVGASLGPGGERLGTLQSGDRCGVYQSDGLRGPAGASRR